MWQSGIALLVRDGRKHLSAVCGVSRAEGTSGGADSVSGVMPPAESGLSTSTTFRKLNSLFMACPATDAILAGNVAAPLISLLSTPSVLPVQYTTHLLHMSALP